MIRCRTARGFADASLERALSLEERFQLDEHCARCPACAEHERRALALQELLEGPGDPPPTAADVEGAVHAVFGALERGEVRSWRAHRARPVVWAAAGVLAVIALVLTRRERPAIDVPVVTVEERETGLAGLELTATHVEDTVRAALLEVFGGSSLGEPSDRARIRFSALTREPARAGWPVKRFVEGLLDSPDAAVSLGAVRCLGALGEASSAPALERALLRPELCGDALAALGEIGEAAVPALERSLRERTLAARALEQLCRIGGERACQAIERASGLVRRDTIPSRETLLDALTTTGPAAVASLLRLAGECRDRAESASILARLPLVEGVEDELVRKLRAERLPIAIACEALRIVQPRTGLLWLEEVSEDFRERPLALATLSAFAGTAPLGSVLRLSGSGRLPREDVLGLLVGLLERDESRAERFTQELLERGDPPFVQAWLALLIESAHPGTGRALVRLAFSDALSEEDRLFAALTVGEIGSEEDGSFLSDRLAAVVAPERRLAAACLVSIHGLLGTEGVTLALSSCSTTCVQRVLSALGDEGRSGAAVRLHRVARSLDGALSELASSARNRKEIL